MSNKNKNYDILDKLLNDANIPARQGGNEWVTDKNHPDGGYWVRSNEDYQQLKDSADAIERYLSS